MDDTNNSTLLFLNIFILLDLSAAVDTVNRSILLSAPPSPGVLRACWTFPFCSRLY